MQAPQTIPPFTRRSDTVSAPPRGVQLAPTSYRSPAYNRYIGDTCLRTEFGDFLIGQAGMKLPRLDDGSGEDANESRGAPSCASSDAGSGPDSDSQADSELSFTSRGRAR